MPLISLAEFFGDLALISVTAEIDSNTSADGLGSGGVNRASFGTRLWYGSAQILTKTHAAADQVAAKMEYLEEADVTFSVAPGWRIGCPVTSGTVTNIDNDRRVVTLSEVRPDGDIFGVTFATGQQMHRVVSSSGLIHTVVPALPFGVSNGNAATFGKPEINAYLTRKKLPAYTGGQSARFSFDWKQDA